MNKSTKHKLNSVNQSQQWFQRLGWNLPGWYGLKLYLLRPFVTCCCLFPLSKSFSSLCSCIKLNEWKGKMHSWICKCTRDALRIVSPKPDQEVVRDAFSHINATKMKFIRKLRTISNEIDSGAVFHPMAADLPGFRQSICLWILFSLHRLLPSSSFLSSRAPFPSVLSSVSICSRHSPSFLVLSLLSVTITLLL